MALTLSILARASVLSARERSRLEADGDDRTEAPNRLAEGAARRTEKAERKEDMVSCGGDVRVERGGPGDRLRRFSPGLG